MELCGADTKLEDLPEDVLCRIFSLLHMRDVARASASCSALLRVWATHPHLTFNEDSLRLRLRPRGEEEMEKEEETADFLLRTDELATAFVRLTDAIVSRHGSDTALEEFTVSFSYLRDRHAPYVDRWVRFALASTTTRRLKLDLLPDGCFNPERLWYTFPLSLLAAGTAAAAALEHLYLRQGSVVVVGSTRPGLSNLATLVLSLVRISSEDLERLLSSCHKLQRLKLRRCKDLEYIKVSPAAGLRQLRFLTVKNCWSMTRIDMPGCVIEALRFDGQNLLPSLLLGSTEAPPALKVTSARLDLQYWVAGSSKKNDMNKPRELELLRLAHAMPCLESLSLHWTKEIQVVTVAPPYPRGPATTTFHHLRRVDLSMRKAHYRRGREDLHFIYPFLDAAPALETLSLHLRRYAPTLCNRRIIVKAPTRIGLPHRSLKAVDISGFDGDLASLQLVLYILDKATALRSLSLQPMWTHHREFIQRKAKEIELIHKAIARHIAPVLPSGVLLQVKTPQYN